MDNTWKDISANIPTSPVNVIKEDPSNENLLYLGTDNGAYVSFDMGNSWEAFSKGLPNVAVHDIVIQPEAKDLLLGTHGRSIYKANIEALQSINIDNITADITFMDAQPVRHSGRWGSSWSSWSDAFEPKTTIQFYSKSSGTKTIKILSEKGAELHRISMDVVKGFNYVDYNLELTDKGKKALMKEDIKLDFKETGNKKYYLPKGVYTIKIDDATTTFEIK